MSSQLIAPPAASVQLLAAQFGAASLTLRFSQHSYSGVVATVTFHSWYGSVFPQARQFCRVASRLAGYPCTMRPGLQQYGFTISVPVAPASPVHLVARPRPVAPAVVFVQPAPAPAGKCVAYLASGQPCSRKATRGHYCGIHARQVM